MKVIVTGTTGMVGEGVLLECLANTNVSEVLSISRRPCNIQHPKLKELLVADFTKLEEHTLAIQGYTACFYCAGISSVGMKEDKYHYITYDTTIAFAKVLLEVNRHIAFCFVSGSHTDSSAKGKVMWARVKGKTENALLSMGFNKQYNFRPGGMLPFAAQKNVKVVYKYLVKLIQLFAPSSVLTLSEIGKAMIYVVLHEEEKQVLEIKDIKRLAQ